MSASGMSPLEERELRAMQCASIDPAISQLIGKLLVGETTIVELLNDPALRPFSEKAVEGITADAQRILNGELSVPDASDSQERP